MMKVNQRMVYPIQPVSAIRKPKNEKKEADNKKRKHQEKPRGFGEKLDKAIKDLQ